MQTVSCQKKELRIINLKKISLKQPFYIITKYILFKTLHEQFFHLQSLGIINAIDT